MACRRTSLGNLLWVLPSVFTWVMAFGVMIGLAIICIPIAVFVRFERFQRKGPAQVMGLVPRLSGSRIVVHFDPGYDPGRVSLYVQNHVSMLDGHIALATIPQVFCGLENAAHLRIPGYGQMMRLGNTIPVYRRSDGRASEIAASARERASRGISILTFPEGHRTLDGGVRPFRTGVFRIARDADLPIVPIAVRGAYKMLPKGTAILRAVRIDVYIGAQVETAGLSDDELVELSVELRAKIAAIVEPEATDLRSHTGG
ncbi:MAG TPA: 1-acyl-sn-glycerol-3-phosphate acyltransferase [Nannocystis exedens]|nr:1-acyl-sn-glycerol-3-phosphate acyltransferase [Nannocystis exedens]